MKILIFIGEVLGGLFVICLISLLFFLVIYSAIAESSEISPESYQKVAEWCEVNAEIKEKARKFTEDGQIIGAEYNELAQMKRVSSAEKTKALEVIKK